MVYVKQSRIRKSSSIHQLLFSKSKPIIMLNPYVAFCFGRYPTGSPCTHSGGNTNLLSVWHKGLVSSGGSLFLFTDNIQDQTLNGDGMLFIDVS